MSIMDTARNGILIPALDIQRRVEEMGAQISRDYGQTDLVIVGILKGSFMFIADLVRQIDPAIPLEVEFMTVSSYGNSTLSSGQLKIDQDITTPLQGKEVLLVEDIVDTGNTISEIRTLLASRGPNSVKVAALLEKEIDRPNPLIVDYVGFRIPNLFVVGYGLDFAQRYRNLKEIRVLNVE